MNFIDWPGARSLVRPTRSRTFADWRPRCGCERDRASRRSGLRVMRTQVFRERGAVSSYKACMRPHQIAPACERMRFARAASELRVANALPQCREAPSIVDAHVTRRRRVCADVNAERGLEPDGQTEDPAGGSVSDQTKRPDPD